MRANIIPAPPGDHVSPNRPPRRAPIRDWIGRPRRVLALDRLDRWVERVGSPIVYGNRVGVFHSGDRAFAAILGAIASARRAVAVEMYHWADDRIGRRFEEALREALARGVSVRVVVDAFGSLGSRGLVSRLASARAVVAWYHPLAPWAARWYPNRRDHRKIVVVDGRVAFLGGLNLAERYAEEFAGDRAWRDLVLEIEGPAVREVVRLFMGTWARVGGDLEGTGDLVAPPRTSGPAGVQVVGGRGLRGRRALRRSYVELLAQARERVLIANAYFAPERTVRRALAAAARRGVAVDLLLPRETDVPLVRYAGRARYGALLRAGVRIREHVGSVLHAKAAVLDGEILFAGSANLDYRSFRHNLEVAVQIFDPEVSREALGGLERDWNRAHEVRLEEWEKRGFGERAIEALATSLAYWL